ncbi:MAG: ABC transporter substrate-binding protein [Porticoccaceae bacterium]|nr:ABC transporter substrate-binding protein [Porticoccaceae bacterium]
MTVTKHLPPPEKEHLKVGFMRLTDSAPLVLAQATGLFSRFGLDVELLREVSWANLRDKLVVGALDAAHLLAPLPMMTSFGAGGLRANLLTGLSLSLNGNAITLSRALWEKLHWEKNPDAAGMTQALARHIDANRDQDVLTLATVHMFSMHTFQLRMWLKAGGIDPDRDVRIIVLPPEQMGDSLARGIIDGFCVGEPWNTLAVQQGSGAVAAVGYDIWNNAPEKVLGVTETWHNHFPGTHLRLRLALMEACQSLSDPQQRTLVAEILSRPEYLDLPVKILMPSLSGHFSIAKHLPPVAIRDFHVFGRYFAGFPWRSQAQWMVKSSAVLLGKKISDDHCQALVQQCYRPDLYREAARFLDIVSPDQDAKPEAAHSGEWHFDDGIVLGADRMIGGDRFLSGV